MIPKRPPLRSTALRVGMLQVAERLPGSRYRCVCDCGAERIVNVGHFNTGAIKSCGCHVTRHGHSGVRSRTYTSYFNMLARCHNPKNKRYADYGGKGIVVCERWRQSFSAFLEDMGECPDGLTIDRIDNALGYNRDNCRWTTRCQNQRNREQSVLWVVRGRVYETAADAAAAFGVSTSTIAAWCKGRIAAGRYYAPKAHCRVIPKYGDASA